ncbi:DNA-binding protein [Paraburkholderia caballeronis]|uniref:DNA-binding protein n=1 Tax=Paraburkholderia caballeronis TaxID=416943 RepID=UPI001065A0EC|nr:DNA-binding protein [Paraburkholderia caballeronis]TDV05109.1 plasmid replication DNA-binding protein KfrA [Paraburkholderia caballeronis]TDV08196.1 plasmid replication DNA-binding protein KfrA [Paraburkholderia caballeronis]TDV19236.1 plasmid replication DNA-binding protein KfrA [Paraburkholderia caballeronis]
MAIDDDRHAIREELEELKKNGARRQELSIHACKRLFFDLGIRPSMATVRELTQTGSASDIPKDIELFWQRIRTASKVRIGAGTLPLTLQEKAGELLGALFDEALAYAHTAFEAERADLDADRTKAAQDVRDAEARRAAADEILQRSEARAEAAWTRVRELESQLAASAAQGVFHHDGLQTTVRKLEAENEALHKRIDTEQATNASLRDRIDALHEDMRKSTEHYAQQIKDALAEAERRVKPMLVELDSLRSMASTWQAGQREASRKEFDFIQQLASAKARADRLDAQLRERSDEIDALNRQVTRLRGQQNVDASVAAVLCELAAAGRLSEEELARIGTAVDGHVELPAHCPKCRDGEPELSQVGEHYELSCPECEHSSGAGHSRLEAVTRFLQGNGEPTVA